MKIALPLLFIVLSFRTLAYISGIAIQTDKPAPMMVTVNGKSVSGQPVSFVHIKSLPGLFHIEVRVFNPFDGMWYMLRKDVVVAKGYDSFFRIEFNSQRKPELREIRKYPVYSRYFVNPAMYNRHLVS